MEKMVKFFKKAADVRMLLIEDQRKFEDELIDIIDLSECELTSDDNLRVKIHLKHLKSYDQYANNIRKYLANTHWILEIDRSGSDLNPVIDFFIPEWAEEEAKKEEEFNPNDRIGDGR